VTWLFLLGLKWSRPFLRCKDRANAKGPECNLAKGALQDLQWYGVTCAMRHGAKKRHEARCFMPPLIVNLDCYWRLSLSAGILLRSASGNPRRHRCVD